MRKNKIIKFSYPFPAWPIKRQLPSGSMIIGDYEFAINDTDCIHPDYWFIFDGLLANEKANCEKDKIYFFTAEPPSFKKYNPDFLRQFGHIITCQRNINHQNVHFYHQGHPWFVNKSYDELIEMEQVNKSKEISIITSNKLITDGHKKRHEFCHQLKGHFGNAIDLYGRGIKDFEDKWNVLQPYKYSVAIENEYLDNWFTEKLYDCFLAETFPLYYGCPNLEKYFNPKSVCNIDINDLSSAIRIIESILSDQNYYTGKIKDILHSKRKYLKEFNIFYLIINFCKTHDDRSKSVVQSIILKPETYFQLSPYSKIKNRLKNWTDSLNL